MTVFVWLVWALLGLVSGVIASIFVGRKKKVGPRCPWSPCGYPLNPNPLVATVETRSHYPVYAQESCPECGSIIIWSSCARAYVRYQPDTDPSVAARARYPVQK